LGIFFGAAERRSSPTFVEPPIPPFPGANVFGSPSVAYMPNTALAVPTVWACVSLLANAVSMLPLETFRMASGIPSRATDPLLITTPSPSTTQSEWLHMLMVSLLLRGNAVGLITTTDSLLGLPTSIEIQNPDQVSIQVDRDTGVTTYKINNNVIPIGKIWHVRGLTLPGQKVGLSPISYAANTIGIDLSARKFAADFFDGGGIPKAVLQSDQRIDRVQGEAVLERFKGKFSGNSREPLVLGAGLKYTPLSVNPEESQFLATMQANVAQIARFFSVPAEMVGGSSGSSMTYTSVEMNGINFLTFSLSFWLKRIEDAMFSLLPEPQYVKFKTDALLRTDAATQATVDIQRIAGRLETVSEIRAREGKSPLTDVQMEEMSWVPALTITPKGGAKAIPAPPAAAPDSEPALADKPAVPVPLALVPKSGGSNA
jgi:HK97 family phage portal protein